MRMTMLAVALSSMLLMPLQAQQAAPVPVNANPSAPTTQQAMSADGIRTEATVVVTGEQPGPGLWLVRNGNHDLWILGTLSPLPAGMQWQSKQLDEIVANAQEVIYEPSLNVNSDISKFRALLLLPSLIGIKNNPDGKRLSEVLPPVTYVRWSAYRDRFLDRDADKLRPAFAAEALWKAAIKRSGMSDKNVAKTTVAAAVERYHPKVTLVRQTITVKDPKAVLKQFKASELEDRICLERTLDRLGQDMETLRARANAWAMGNVAAIRALPQNDQYQACMEAITESGIGRKLGMGDVAARLQAEWLAKAEAALATNTTTLAILPMQELLRAGDVMDQLKAKGYTVLAPDE
ncbi:TraB/GumN family protein [Thermomonas sp. HDW16]|uniref:TraB/GumN family protein n=1 Tax=Thermomonas sp. HDW16 TaxID=2714945 RepID=UPI00140BF75B|nr:TraB/GumN family protein [Thermomonas sp. HDW16]QIL20220.1 TraB/GumN family protein [Thermomonas sp. HDW16]